MQLLTEPASQPAPSFLPSLLPNGASPPHRVKVKIKEEVCMCVCHPRTLGVLLRHGKTHPSPAKATRRSPCSHSPRGTGPCSGQQAEARPRAEPGRRAGRQEMRCAWRLPPLFEQ